jgi:serine/threonine protein kinase
MGSVLYELLSGTLPVELESVEQVIADLVNHRLIPLRRHNSQLPKWIYQVLDRALHPNIEERYNSAGVFLQALDQQTAYPGGEASDDARTSLFVRVDLNTPPPELLDRFARGNGDTAEVASDLASKPFESQITDPDLPSHRDHHWEGSQERSSDRFSSEEVEEGSETVPIQRAFHQELADEGRPIPGGQITDTDPVRRPVSKRPRPWVTVALALLILVATSLIIYFGLLLQ